MINKNIYVNLVILNVPRLFFSCPLSFQIFFHQDLSEIKGECYSLEDERC